MIEEQRISKKLWENIVVTTLLFLMMASILLLEDNRTVRDNILSKNFITVQLWYVSNKVSFDLENRSFFSIGSAQAVKDGKFYEGYIHVTNDGAERFEKRKKYTLYYSLIANNVTKRKVRHEKFRVKQKIPKEYRQVIESLTKRLSTSEMIVIYNKNYLPVEIQLYDKVDKKWTMLAKYSYPYKSRKEYEKDLDECIEAVLNGDFGED